MSLVRRILVNASESRWLRERAPRLSWVRKGAERFLPGEDADSAIAAARRLAADGISSLLTHLGENVRDRAESEAVTKQYLDLLDRIRTEALSAEISVKLTQLGLDLDRELCLANLTKLLEYSAGRTVWIDMEQSQYLDSTFELHARAHKTHPHVGICVQAYLYRTAKDVESLISMGSAVRLVKGAYNEPRQIAYPKNRMSTRTTSGSHRFC